MHPFPTKKSTDALLETTIEQRDRSFLGVSFYRTFPCAALNKPNIGIGLHSAMSSYLKEKLSLFSSAVKYIKCPAFPPTPDYCTPDSSEMKSRRHALPNVT